MVAQEISEKVVKKATTYELARDTIDELISIDEKLAQCEIAELTTARATRRSIELELTAPEARGILEARRKAATEKLRALGFVPPAPAAAVQQRLRDREPESNVQPDTSSLQAARAAIADSSDPCEASRVPR